jgi:catechol 2,3-dioxygenase-like lactoylglutathione lyase family enzyme
MIAAVPRAVLYRVALLAFALCLAPFAVAQSAPAAPTASVTAPAAVPPLAGIANIAIRVKDIPASVDFYHKLGFDQAFTNNAPDGTITQSFIKLNDRQYIELSPVTSTDPQPGFLYVRFETANLDALHSFYAAHGLAPSAPRATGADNQLFTLQGPQQSTAHQTIQFSEIAPGSKQSLAIGKLLGPDRVGDKLVLVALPMQDPAAARDFYIAKLGFTPSQGRVYRLNLPGPTGESVEIVPADALGAKASITLTTSTLDKSAAQLQRQGVQFQRASEMFTGADGHSTELEMIGLTDPDGNIIRIQAVQ